MKKTLPPFLILFSFSCAVLADTTRIIQSNVQQIAPATDPGNYFVYQSFLFTPIFWIVLISIPFLGILFITLMLGWNRVLARRVNKKTAQLSETIEQLRQEINDRQKAEGALVESERRYRFLFDESPAGSVIIDNNGLVKDMNRSFQNTLGYMPEEVLGRSAVEFVKNDDRNRIRQWLSSRLKSEDPTEDAGKDTPIFAKDGTIHYINFARGQSLLYTGEKLDGILITGIDVTERKRAEEFAKQQEQKLIQADKMATLGILVSGIAHEINNPNNFIILNSDNLFDIWKDLKPVLEKYSLAQGDFMLAGLHYSEIKDDVGLLITGITDGAKRIRNIVQNLKDFARQEPGGIDQMVQVNEAVTAANVILGNLIKKSTDNYRFVEGENIPFVKGGFQKIEQVVINLITNACQALTKRSQEVTVTTRFVKETNRVLIVVTDQGTGISAENLKQIMTPFFTTKRDTGGTGLGLSISYNIVKEHGGELTIESELDKGTVATVYLPLGNTNY